MWRVNQISSTTGELLDAWYKGHFNVKKCCSIDESTAKQSNKAHVINMQIVLDFSSAKHCEIIELLDRSEHSSLNGCGRGGVTARFAQLEPQSSNGNGLQWVIWVSAEMSKVICGFRYIEAMPLLARFEVLYSRTSWWPETQSQSVEWMKGESVSKYLHDWVCMQVPQYRSSIDCCVWSESWWLSVSRWPCHRWESGTFWHLRALRGPTMDADCNSLVQGVLEWVCRVMQ